MAAFRFTKSSYSSGNGECVEVARNVRGVVAVRDSKQVCGGVLVVASAAWNTFRCSLGQAAVD
ncbi:MULTISPECIES: DUF397 domain-containing protein [unclassified Streptomyces]|uniref:DUF397 domain-containing protein n=1 Tax=unclassified Streptomyces TaxID=2593676 RepID=UPI000DADCC6A|nr:MULTISPECIES: DUF397 domain-containing protein [unclassified Streptomyces]PZT72794.1 DUF397 domain-containing protein [Streptomyces sp. AC1-42T]PZT80888.1 DUF397 domain-containing protein [Streptomyces sp. AC1-42W]